ncbi:MAG: hypothetical protein J5I99_08925 [Verrucomicrobia bacterium]|nr:hypothetical protein [Verrucomicrobiota bacterium]
MHRKSGEVITLVLVGLALGSVATMIRAHSWAQQRANEMGAPVGAGAFFSERPVEALSYPVLGAAAGWGISALADNSAKSESRSITIHAGRDSTVVISERDGPAVNNQQRPTTIYLPAADAGGSEP